MDDPAPRPPRAGPGRPVGWLVVAAVAFPLSFGLFWLARDSGSARPQCGDRPGRFYPACPLPPPFGTGAPPTTAGYQP